MFVTYRPVMTAGPQTDPSPDPLLPTRALHGPAHPSVTIRHLIKVGADGHILIVWGGGILAGWCKKSKMILDKP